MLTRRYSMLLIVIVLTAAALACGPVAPSGDQQATIDAAVQQTLAADEAVTATVPAASATPLPTSEPGITPTAPPVDSTAVPLPSATPLPGGKPAPITPSNVLDLQILSQTDVGESVTALGWRQGLPHLLVGTNAGVDVIDPGGPSTVFDDIYPDIIVREVLGSPDGYVLGVEPGEGAPRLWNLQADAPLDDWNERFADATQIAFAPNQFMVASAHEDLKIRVWNSTQEQVVQTLDPAETVDNVSLIYGLEFSLDSRTLAAFVDVEGMPTVVLWDVESTEQLDTFDPMGLIAGPVAYPVLSPGWWNLAWVSRGTVILVNMRTGEEAQSFSHEDFVGGISFFPDGSLLATSAYRTIDGAPQPVIHFWDVQTGELIGTLAGDFATSPLLAFSPDGTMLASADSSTVKVWYIPTEE